MSNNDVKAVPTSTAFVLELNVLSLNRPGLDATRDQVAAWYLAKGQLHESLATGLAGKERADELSYAATAFEHARSLSSLVGAS
jgi:hypothetical protein